MTLPPTSTSRLGARITPLQRRAVAQNLLDCGGQKIAARFEKLPLLRIFDETQNRVIDEVGGRLLARYNQELKESQDLFPGQMFTTYFGRDEPGQKIVLRRGPALLDHLREISIHFDGHGPEFA